MQPLPSPQDSKLASLPAIKSSGTISHRRRNYQRGRLGGQACVQRAEGSRSAISHRLIQWHRKTHIAARNVRRPQKGLCQSLQASRPSSFGGPLCASWSRQDFVFLRKSAPRTGNERPQPSPTALRFLLHVATHVFEHWSLVLSLRLPGLVHLKSVALRSPYLLH